MGTTVNLMVTAQNAQENNIQPLQDYIESLAWWEASLTCVNPMLAGGYGVSKAIWVGAIKGVHFDRDALIANFLQCYFLTPTEAQLFIDEEDKGEHDVFEMYSYTALKAVKHKDYSGFRPLSSHIPVSINFIDAVSEDNLVIRSRELVLVNVDVALSPMGITHPNGLVLIEAEDTAHNTYRFLVNDNDFRYRDYWLSLDDILQVDGKPRDDFLWIEDVNAVKMEEPADVALAKL